MHLDPGRLFVVCVGFRVFRDVDFPTQGLEVWGAGLRVYVSAKGFGLRAKLCRLEAHMRVFGA